MKKTFFAFSALASSVAFGIDANTVHDDIPGNATIGEIVAAGGGGGGGGGTSTNDVNALIEAAVRGTNTLAHLADIPSTNGFVTASITNGLARLADVAVASSAATNHAAGLCARTATSATNYTDTATNALGAALRGEIATATPADYAAVSNAAMRAVQPNATNFVTRNFILQDGPGEYARIVEKEQSYAGNWLFHGVADRTEAFGDLRLYSIEYNSDAHTFDFKWRAGQLGVYWTSSLKPDNSPVVTENMMTSAFGQRISAADPTFSNAVLAVGLNVDTNALAVLGEIGSLPVTPGQAGAGLGALLAALASAVAWLKKNKVGKYELVSTSATIKAADRSVTKVTLADTAVTVTFPDADDGKTRDFILRIDAAALATGGSLTITKPTGAVIYGDAFPSPEATKQYLVTITETAANEFYVRSLEVTIPTEA